MVKQDGNGHDDDSCDVGDRTCQESLPPPALNARAAMYRGAYTASFERLPRRFELGFFLRFVGLLAGGQFGHVPSGLTVPLRMASPIRSRSLGGRERKRASWSGFKLL